MEESRSELTVVVQRSDPPTLKLSGEADFHNRHRIQEEFDGLLSLGHTRVRADLTDLVYMDSSGISALVCCAAKAAGLGGSIELMGASRQVSRVLNLCGAVAFFASATEEAPTAREGDFRPPSANYWHVCDFSLPATAEAAAAARGRVAGVVRSLPLSLSDGEDVLLAAGEALANAVRHGCAGNPELQIQVKCVAGPHRLVIHIIDPGPGFDPENASPPVPRRLADGGMGIRMMRKLMDEVSFAFEGGTVVRLVKYIPNPEEEPERD